MTLGSILVQYFLWRSIFETRTEIRGLGMSEMMLYIVSAEFLQAAMNVGIDNRIHQGVKSGSIVFCFLRPMSFISQMFGEALGISAFRALVHLPLAIAAVIILGTTGHHLSAFGAVSFALSLSLAYILNFALDMILGYLVFYTRSIWGIGSLKITLLAILSGRLVPLDFFPGWARDILDFLPFSSLFYRPLSFLIKDVSTYETAMSLLIQIGWVAFMGAVVVWIGRSMLRKLEIQGG